MFPSSSYKIATTLTRKKKYLFTAVELIFFSTDVTLWGISACSKCGFIMVIQNPNLWHIIRSRKYNVPIPYIITSSYQNCAGIFYTCLLNLLIQWLFTCCSGALHVLSEQNQNNLSDTMGDVLVRLWQVRYLEHKWAWQFYIDLFEGRNSAYSLCLEASKAANSNTTQFPPIKMISEWLAS